MRNVFVSYSHRLDQNDMNVFINRFGNYFRPGQMVFSNRSLQNQDLSHLSDDTIKDNYIRPKIRDSSVTIILIGQETGGRWWVDWEIYYSLLKTKDNDRNGLLGILLPNKVHFIPQRLEDNVPGNGLIVPMPVTASRLERLIEDAYAKRHNLPDLSKPLRVRNSYL